MSPTDPNLGPLEDEVFLRELSEYGEHMSTAFDSWFADLPEPPKLPPWVDRVWQKLWDSHFGWIEKIEEIEHLEHLGVAMGCLRWASEQGEIIVKGFLKQARSLGLQKQAKTRLRKIRELLVGSKRAVKYLTRKIDEYPPYLTKDFHKGFADGVERSPVDKKGRPILKHDTTMLYLILVFNWPSVEKMKGFGELHVFLRKFLNRNQLGDLERLRTVCKRVGLHVGKRGRPRKAKK